MAREGELLRTTTREDAGRPNSGLTLPSPETTSTNPSAPRLIFSKVETQRELSVAIAAIALW
jgi:hypothetical protein